MKIRVAQPGEPVDQADKDIWKERARRFLKRGGWQTAGTGRHCGCAQAAPTSESTAFL